MLSPTKSATDVRIDPVAATYVALVSASTLMTEGRVSGYVPKIERIATLLGLSPSELARLLDVTREGLRRWLAGKPIASDRWQTIDALSDAVEQLTHYVNVDRLPSVVRRESAALDGSTPLNWLVAGRYRDLLQIFKRVFSYQVTQ
jgi:AraC-like DNA-binding protein